MTKEINITVTGVSIDEDSHETTTTVTARGQYFERDCARFLLYSEEDPETGALTGNTLKLTDNLLELTRRGSVRCRMVFEPGKSHRISYVTPYGTLLLDLFTQELTADWSERDGEIRLAYSLYNANSLLSQNKLFIKIKGFSENGLNFQTESADIKITNHG
ncbi:MAG: DUF1934 domain-containing protein [Roseburia sp.]|nr:DUF1934 domain-containing protein [Roseburia sp.]MCM1097866.1 DUF1934 domain-containing protein [Ruminococcus flavefaciens]